MAISRSFNNPAAASESYMASDVRAERERSLRGLGEGGPPKCSKVSSRRRASHRLTPQRFQRLRFVYCLPVDEVSPPGAGALATKITLRSCLLKVFAAAGVAFLALAASSDNLVKYLFGPGYLWIVGGSILAALWAYESYCREDVHEER